MEYLFYGILLFLLIICCFQDFKRREIDNWLNLFIFLIGSFYVFFIFFTTKNIVLIFSFTLLLIINFGLSNLFYYGRIFAGGDSKLLLALTPLLVSFTVKQSLSNLLLFLLLIFIAGAAYGLLSIIYLSFKDWKKIKVSLLTSLKKRNMKIISIGGLLFCFLGVINNLFFFLGLVIIIYPFLFILAKSLDEESMTKKIKGTQLREGDLLAEDINYKKKFFKKYFEGLTKEQIKILKNKKYVKIKDGIPFAPTFLLAFILYLLIKMGILFLPYFS